ncbi:MAG TPA: tetratricopeptide repeat protein [Pseudomonadales bacterium]|nr:tetratricopeptide repeat protein [Pseudomonadales bacterium]
MNSESEGNRCRTLAVGALVIVLLTFAAYCPVLPGSFLMDDSWWVGNFNPLINGTMTPYNLWFQMDFTLAAFGWWVEHLVFGPNPAGYHVVNIALQAISSILFWRLLVRLEIPGAWLAAALFAVHPVCVNSVARISELKNTLSLPFFILSFLAYLRYEATALYPTEQASSGQRRSHATLWYTISLVAFVLALLAKTTVVVLPVLLLFCAMWQRRRITDKDILHTLPFFVLSFAFGLMSIWFQKHQALATTELPLPPASFPQRVAGAGYCFWFYLGKALFPFNLCVQYPRWTIDPHTVTAFLPDVLVCVLFILCLWFRHSWGRHALFGLGCFLAMLFPSLGFFDAQFLTMWQVSDHLQYPALAAIVALAASAISALPNQTVYRCVAGILVLGSSVLCFQRAEVFSTPEKLLADTIAKNPSARDAYNELGIIQAKKGDYSGALEQFQFAVKYDPDNCDAWMDLGHTLTMQGKFAEAEQDYLTSLKIRPNASPTHKLYAALLQRQGRNAEALYQLRLAAIFDPSTETYMNLASLEFATGDSHLAVTHFRRALAFGPDPNEANVLNNLAWILATSPDDSIRNGSEAVRYGEQACQMTAFKQAGMVGTLAAAYAEAGRFPEAIATSEKAIQLASAAGNGQLVTANQQLLLLYRAGRPYHEKSTGN